MRKTGDRPRNCGKTQALDVPLPLASCCWTSTILMIDQDTDAPANDRISCADCRLQLSLPNSHSWQPPLSTASSGALSQDWLLFDLTWPLFVSFISLLPLDHWLLIVPYSIEWRDVKMENSTEKTSSSMPSTDERDLVQSMRKLDLIKELGWVLRVFLSWMTCHFLLLDWQRETNAFSTSPTESQSKYRSRLARESSSTRISQRTRSARARTHVAHWRITIDSCRYQYCTSCRWIFPWESDTDCDLDGNNDQASRRGTHSSTARE